ncbi:MAG: ABC transporter permease [Acidobacteriia bacterium]|nr:ABC transporter permease [Terriglobia bacterium]
MKKIFYIIKREYLQRVRSKLFLVGTILTPLLLVGIIFISIKFSTMKTSVQHNIALIDLSGQVAQPFAGAFTDKLDDGKPQYNFQFINENRPLEQIQGELSKRVMSRQLDGYMVFSKNVLEDGKAEYHARNVADLTERAIYSQTLSNLITNLRLRKEGLDPAKIEGLTRKARVTMLKISESGDKEERGQTFGVSYVLMMILYTTILMYGITVMRSVIEEKTSRVVEIMLSAVRPTELMAGKIIGVSLVAMTQYLIWAAAGTLIFGYGLAAASSVLPNAAGYLPKIPPYVFVYFVVFFLLGFLLYATLYAAIGAMVNNDQEAQQVQMPVTMLIVVPIIMVGLVIRTPDSPTVVALSMVPFFAPILMFMRITIQTPPWTQIVACIALMLATIGLLIWLSAKIYRVGILMYGKRPSLPELMRWLRYS